MPDVVYTVIGDLVASRSVPDRAAVQDALGDALTEVNRSVPVAQPFQPTVGDEYQGACATLPDAVLASLLVRLALLPGTDVRCGLGHGEVTVHDAGRAPLLQDGPGWWSAREAIGVLGARRDRQRTWYVGPGQSGVNAFLVCRDQVVDRLNDRGVRMLRLALLGRTQKEIAEIEGIWPSAVSQQFTRSIGAVVESMRLLGQTDPPTPPAGDEPSDEGAP